MKCQRPVFAGHRNDVGGNSGGHEVEVFEYGVVIQVELRRQRGDQLKAYSAAAEILVGISAILLFWIEDRHGRRQFVVRQVMIAYDEIDADVLGIGYQVHRLDAAVEGNDQG